MAGGDEARDAEAVLSWVSPTYPWMLVNLGSRDDGAFDEVG